MAANRASASTLLRIYLNDHLAAMTAEMELARRCRSNNQGTDLAHDLGRLIGELQEDERHVHALLERCGMRESRAKQVLAVAAERIGRLKLNGQLRGYSDLSRLVELEALCLAAEHRLHLWQSLQTSSDPRVGELPLDDLMEKASRQRDRLEEHRLDAAQRAFRTSGR